MVIVILDFDGTLVKENSGELFYVIYSSLLRKRTIIASVSFAILIFFSTTRMLGIFRKILNFVRTRKINDIKTFFLLLFAKYIDKNRELFHPKLLKILDIFR